MRALGRFGATADGKICAPCMIRGVRAAKAAPSWQDLRAVYPQTAVCRAFRMHGAHILPKPAHFGCMARESCHELAIFPSEATFGIHEAKKLPRIDARERTVVRSCHGKALGDVPREYIATASRPRTHSRRSCHGRTLGFAPHQTTAALPAKKTAVKKSTAVSNLSNSRKAFCPIQTSEPFFHCMELLPPLFI